MSSSTSRKVAFGASEPTSIQLRALVLDYLSHQSFTRTARAFARDSAVRHLDADGDEVMFTPEEGQTRLPQLSEDVLSKAELRSQVRNALLAGKVGAAIDLLNTHFPTVLDADDSTPKRAHSSHYTYVAPTSVEPSHLNLNLCIQFFIESCRTVPLDYPPQQTSPETTKSQKRTSQALDDDPKGLDQQTALLKQAQKLYARASMLIEPDRERYIKELGNVLGLLAYKVPEESSVAKYLSQERREAIAEQINSAILHRTGMRVISNLELAIRYTSTVWGVAHDFHVSPLPGALLPPSNDDEPTGPSVKAAKDSSNGKEQQAPIFDLALFIQTKG